jgi:hypothetical protein
MRYSNGAIKAQMITQIEANELSNRIKNRDINEASEVWIQTVHGSVYAGDVPKNISGDYYNIKEQLHFLNGDIEVLSEHMDTNSWFSAPSYSEKMAYFKHYIAPDEAFNAQNLSFVENKLLKELETKQHADEKLGNSDAQRSYIAVNPNKTLSKSKLNIFPNLNTNTACEDDSDEDISDQPSP